MNFKLKELKDKYNLKFNGVLHIGAHTGEEFTEYIDNDIKPVIFIEPQKNIFEKLLKEVNKKEDWPVICLNTALGNIVGETDFYTNDNDENGASSVLEPSNRLNREYPHIILDKKIKVPITKIDLLEIPKCNFLNIDVQGYELEVLKGGENYLTNVDSILIEVNDTNQEALYLNTFGITDIDLFLERFGFKRVETNMCGGFWGDAFYIKNYE